jgi:hypothetical protein
MGPKLNISAKPGSYKPKTKKRTKSQASPETTREVNATQPDKRQATSSTMASSSSQCAQQSMPVYPNMNNQGNANMNNQLYTPQPPQYGSHYYGGQMSVEQPSQSHQMLNVNQSILNKLEAIENRLKSLDNIEATLTTMNTKLETVDTRVSHVEKNMTTIEKAVHDLENSRSFDSNTIDELKERHKTLEKDISTNKQSKEDIQSLKRENSQLKESVIDLQARSMRDNLLFFNFPEKQRSDHNKYEMENCECKILDFCVKELKIENAKDIIKLDRTHRIGKYNSAKTRPIVVKFNYYKHKELVRTKAREHLQGSPFGVSDQYPREIQERRRALMPIKRQAHSEGKVAVLNYDKLYINNQLYRPPSAVID